MRVCLMIEGQEGVGWDHWHSLGESCERAGFEALLRSDHYLSVAGRSERGSLDAWATLAGLAATTSTIRLGTLVSPATFRHPSVLAKSAVTVDHVSGGRVEVGLGAGWLEAEHRAYGFPFPSTRERFDVLAEQLEIVSRSWGSERFSFRGEHYVIEDLDALPKPLQQPHPPLIVGGSGGPRSLSLAARWGDEYNTVFATPDKCRALRGALSEACERAGRDDIPLSLMTGVVVGESPQDVAERGRRLEMDDLPQAWLVGTTDQVVERLRALESAGVERVMLQHLLHDDLDAVELIGREVIPAVS